MFVIDGNFKAVHLCQRHPEADVYVLDGTGFMAAQAPYLKYLDQGSYTESSAEVGTEFYCNGEVWR